MSSSKTRGLIFIIICVVAGVIIFNVSSRQSESDCSKAETFDKSSSKCVLKTATEYVNEIAKIDKAESKANTEKGRRNGTVCIPASEAYKYIGVTGCVRLGVYTSNHTGYGYGWLDSESSSSPTEFVVFAKNNVLSVADTNYYFGRIIEVSGTIESYEGKAQIEITSKSAIKDIESIADHQARVNSTLTEITHNATCENYLNFKDKCEKGLDMACSVARNYDSTCKGYVSSSSDSLDTRRKKCYEDKIKSASTKTQKDSIYESCKNP